MKKLINPVFYFLLFIIFTQTLYAGPKTSKDIYVLYAIPLKEWEPVNDNDDPFHFDRNRYGRNRGSRIVLKNIQAIYQAGTPINLMVCDVPDWMVLNPDSSEYREFADAMIPEFVESICGYLVYLRDDYGVQVKSLEINKAGKQWVKLLITESVQNEIIDQMK